ncbi:peptidase [Planktothrix phage PaV-LD]|uniref:peptidase n=1 Tax=Planktothrix phage PaV-LD TaxID=994601 RepID=UPI000243C96A|nr:peptidase [Planktothrix phage PaV-LD]ADZ31630.1 peptidase M23 [Planktothrix phage PaV-LD]
MNQKLEERIKDFEEQLDDAYFWLFVVAFYMCYTVVKFGIPSPQVPQSSTATSSQTVTLGKDAPKFIYPHSTPYPVTSGFGMREHPVTGGQKMHNGIDFAAPSGANILAVADGQVSFAGDMGGCGNAVEINHSGGYLSKYCHALKVLVQKGQSVKAGTPIALVGTTGTSTGNHLHLGIKLNGKYIDPKKVIPIMEPKK